MKNRTFLTILSFLCVSLLILVACTPSGDTVVAEIEAESGEHMEDGMDHHEADEHGEDEHMEDQHEADEHGEDEHMEEQNGADEHGTMAHIHADVPHEYEGLQNPFVGDETAVAAGKEIFETYCFTCHGLEGHGDGPAAEPLDPKPADLSDGMMMMDLGDDYLFWRVNEGGAMEPFNSAMPAWKMTLSEEQIWQVVSYVRTLSSDN